MLIKPLSLIFKQNLNRYSGENFEKILSWGDLMLRKHCCKNMVRIDI